MSGTKQSSQERTLTTTISLEQRVHRRLKHLAVDRGVSVRDLIREAIEEYLSHDEQGNSSISSANRD
jgi:predicted DNA-binding ribbon-helix-helix protein